MQSAPSVNGSLSNFSGLGATPTMDPYQRRSAS